MYKELFIYYLFNNAVTTFVLVVMSLTYITAVKNKKY